MPRTLAEWESIIQPQFERVRLLGEIPLSRADVQEIGSLLRAEIKLHSNLHRATDWIIKRHPHTFAVFLATFAAHNTEREFWEALGRLLDVSGSDLNNTNWRKHFIEILKQNNKRTFDDVGSVTKKYVTSMRIHGGIPAYSLRDFFENMLMPAVKKPEYRELNGQELLGALLNRSSVQLFTDSPVRDFFENSGDIGLDFLENCLQLARRYHAEGGIPSGLDLPLYVCNAFADYIEGVGSEEHRLLRRPRLLFEPDGEGLCLDLPEQPIRGVNVGEAFWDITTENSNATRREAVQICRRERDIMTKQLTITLGPPAKTFQVTFFVKADNVVTITKTWMLRLLLDDVPPLLVFRVQDYSLLRWSQALPAQPLLLVYPKDITLQFDQFEDDAHPRHVASLYAPGWQDWRAEVWSLEQAGALRLLKNGVEIAFIPVQGHAETPSLFGPQPFAPNIDSKPLYVGEIPNLHIPLHPGYVQTGEIKRWRLELASLWDASPQIRQEFKLIEKGGLLTYNEASVEVNLEALLGKDAVGTYALRVTNGRETDEKVHFRLWPSLRLDDLPPIILPAFPTAQESSPSSIAFRLTLPVAATCEPQAGAYGITISGEYGCYKIAVEEGITRADLNLALKKNGEQVIHIPLSIPIPRLEWRVTLGDEKAIQWTTRPLNRSLDVFLQAALSPEPVSLLVRIFGFEQFSQNIVVHLLGTENVSPEFLPEKSPLGSDYLRFALNKAFDTLKENIAPAFFEFQLTLLDPTAGQVVRLPLLILSRAIEIREVILEQNSAGEPVLLWDEPHPIRHRRLFIRSPWQPWNLGWEIPIPNEARGELTLSNMSLPPSRYEICFYTASSLEPRRQTPSEAPTHIVQTIDPDKHLLWLADQIQKHPNQSFRRHFERACVYETMSMTVRRDEEIQYCYDHLNQASLELLLAFYNWLANYNEHTQKAVHMKMYRPELLRKLFTEHKPGSEFRRAYLKYVHVNSMKPDSLALLVKHEDDPLVVLHSLRALIGQYDARSLELIVELVQSGRLADSDATDLLLCEREFSLSELTTSTPTLIHSRLLSRVLQHLEDSTAVIANFSNNQLVVLVEAETDPVAIKNYLVVLITREDVRGIEQAMRLFQNGFLLGNEVADLLGHNARFAMRVLKSAPDIQAYLAQASELAHQYPEQTGHVIPEMFVQVLDGWARIMSIEDKDGQSLQIIRDDNCEVVLRLELQPNSASPLSAVLDRREEMLILPGGTKFYQCGNCSFIASDQRTILDEHTRRVHGGMGASVRGLSSPIPIYNELKFSTLK